MTAMFSNDNPDKGSGSRSGNHKPGQTSGLRKKKPKVKAGITESGQPLDRALVSPLAKPPKTAGFPVADASAKSEVKPSKTGKASSLRSR